MRLDRSLEQISGSNVRLKFFDIYEEVYFKKGLSVPD